MPSRILSEFIAKKLYYIWDKNESFICSINRDNLDLDKIKNNISVEQKLVIKVDQQIKGRMKKGLVKIGISPDEIPIWINTIDQKYKNFIVESQVSNIDKEIYLLMRNHNLDTEIIILVNGGINVGDVSQMHNVPNIIIKFNEEISDKIDKINEIIGNSSYSNVLIDAIRKIYQFYQKFHLTFLEINPLAISNNKYFILDVLAKYDSCSIHLWDKTESDLLDLDILTDDNTTNEEKYIDLLGKKTGSSLKFKLLEPNSRVWFILFGGGASVCYFDKWMKIVEKNNNLFPANYGELSGNPSRDFVYQYVKQIFSLMKKSNSSNKPYYLIIGGGIANFTLVDKTFGGIIDAINDFNELLVKKNVKIFVRRGGPNYQKGLDMLSKCCQKYNIYCETYGPEKQMTYILDIINMHENNNNNNNNNDLIVYETKINIPVFNNVNTFDMHHNIYQFTSETTCFIYGSQFDVAQNMLDFDIVTGRLNPSIVGFIDPTRNNVTNTQLFWKNKSILIPIYPNFDLAIKKHPNSSGLINFASFRTAYESTKKALQYDNIKFVSVLAEGITENQTKELIIIAKKMNKMLLGPSTIGAIFPGRMRIGNAGGKLDHLVSSGLHKIGSVGIVTRSGGLLNELCHIVSKLKLGISTAIAIGGDRYTGTEFSDVVKYFETDDNIKIIVMLGEIGGTQEIDVANLVQNKYIKKPIIGLCLGSSAEYLAENIQFGHAGADANTEYEKAISKNSYMANCGIKVPRDWDDIENILNELANTNNIEKNIYGEQKNILSFKEANESGIVRKHPNFFSSISNETGEEVTYNQVPISSIENIGYVIGQLWFKKNLPDYLTEYYEKILIVCADHGPCVSGAQNTMVASRAGKDLVSSLCSGLLTIGPKFGGAINEAANKFYYGMKNKKDPLTFVKETKLIPGIGHKHYSIYQPDNRVKILSTYVDKYFVHKETIEFAKSVENITVQKKPNLILNVDGFIAVSMIDGFYSAGFSEEEIEDILQNDFLNAFFILARTIGLIGHHIDQKRLKQDLYRAPDYDVCYVE